MGAVLHDGLLDALGREIVDGVTPVGSALTLDGICVRFGVSRTVAREAMRMLESMRLITSRRRVGLVVRPREEWDVFDPRLIRWRLDGPQRADQLRSLTELRLAVEPHAAACAAAAAGRQEGDELLALTARMRRLGEEGRLAEFMELDIEFHARLLRASGNEMFAALTDVVAEVLRGRTEHGLMPPHPEEEALAAHEAVAAAVRAGDAEAAEAAMSLITTEVRRALAAAPATPSSSSGR
ncbi:MAG: GntR family transcriptional regulator [Cellulomonas sp. 14-74-6]|nr:MAG: GntR family transcriptional regulator [Cellulomonas sp. 14-74-6]